MSIAAQSLTIDEYIELEHTTGERHEYLDGEVREMVGGSGPHSLISTNLLVALHRQVSRRGCQVHGSDLRISLPEARGYTYADIVISDGAPQFVAPKDSLVNPLVIVEVLSPTTEAHDRGDKFERYRSIDSFQEYLLVSQDRPRIERFVRQDDGNWLQKIHADPQGEIVLESVDCRLAMADVYAQVDFSDGKR
ncbi:MAG: Uma2 family endonuclease [Planctomycetaceae bacterium]